MSNGSIELKVMKIAPNLNTKGTHRMVHVEATRELSDGRRLNATVQAWVPVEIENIEEIKAEALRQAQAYAREIADARLE